MITLTVKQINNPVFIPAFIKLRKEVQWKNLSCNMAIIQLAKEIDSFLKDSREIFADIQKNYTFKNEEGKEAMSEEGVAKINELFETKRNTRIKLFKREDVYSSNLTSDEYDSVKEIFVPN